MPEFGFFNEDCMEGMKRYPDNFFGLAVVDPPYGSGEDTEDVYNRFGNPGSLFERYKPSPVGGGIGTGSARDSTVTRASGTRTEHAIDRTGRSWAKKYAKKS